MGFLKSVFCAALLALAACHHTQAPVGARGTHVTSRMGPTEGATQVHIIRAGDTLWRLARAYGTDVATLRELNRDVDPDVLRVGMRLNVPASAEGSTSSRHQRKVDKRFPLQWPVSGPVTSRFGKRWGKKHKGIDIGASRGTPVRAAAAGKVVFSDRQSGYGNMVILKHGSGLLTVYAHHDRNLVRSGQSVSTGDVIAKVGSTGRSTAPHLHFEVRRGAKATNPLRFLPP